MGIKAHIIKLWFGHIMLDGVDALYRNYLDVVLSALEDRYGDRLWFATMAEVAERARAVLAPGPDRGRLMGLAVEINPSALEDEYLAGLNRSFGHWGDRDVYAGPSSERWVRAPPTSWSCGTNTRSSPVPRFLPDRALRGHEFLVGVMTGSWTLPAARGRGAFSQVIDESRRLLAVRGGDALIAFVTHDNASRRRLVAAGCSRFRPGTWPRTTRRCRPPMRRWSSRVPRPSTSCSAPTAAGRTTAPACPSCTSVRRLGVAVPRAAAAGRASGRGRVPVSRRACASLRQGPLDRRPGSPAALAGLLARAVETGRQLFVFTLHVGMAEALDRLGMAAKPGSLTVLDEPSRVKIGSPGTSGVAYRVAVAGRRSRLIFPRPCGIR